ncbi:MAG: PAS domain S-box protein [Candidatus Thiodiazotropha sp. (ex Myrtea sp. 'scaly one' KF741663)]|nr:PAS domain S-box protein [Candidatus Thiodiazotropha sp. (ex Myrtea sp. 'scaly one' KF741663)]
MNARAIGRYAICVLLILFCCAAHGEITPDGKRVLLLYSYHPGFPTSQRILAGIRSIFSSGHRLIDIEYMDTKRLYNEESLENFHQQLSYKLVNRDPYDLVITADDNALDYVLGLGKNLFGKTDKVFLGVNDIQKAVSLDARPDVTGVVEVPSFQETIDLVKTIFPQRKRAYILVDGTPSGQSDLRSIQEVVEGEKALRFETISLEDINWQTFTNQLSAIDQDGVIFLISAYRDVDETPMTFEESLQIIRNATDLPIFHFWRHGMGKGILGGVIIDHYAQGREAAVLAAQILDGSSASTPPITRLSPNVTTLDYNLLMSYGVDQTRLPDEVDWVNLPENKSNPYRTYFLYTLVGLGSLLMVLSVLIPLLRKYWQLTRKITKSEQQYRTIVENSHDGIWQIDSEGRTTFVNQTLANMFGYSIEEMQGKSMYDFMDETAIRIAQNNLQRRSSGIAESHDFKFQHKDGHDVWTRMNTSPINDSGDRFIGALAMVSDITEVRRESLRLKESEEKFNQLTHAIREVFWLGSPDWQEVYYVSPGYESVWGRSCQTLYEDATSWMKALPHEDLLKVEVFLAEQGRVPWEELHFPEYRVVRPDGEICWIDAKAFAIFDESGKLHRVAGVAEDVTGRKNKELELSHRLDLEKLITNQASLLLEASVDELDQQLEGLLQKVALFSASDRAYIFQFDSTFRSMSNTHEWCAEGVSAQKQKLQRLSLSEFQYMLGLFAEDKPLFIQTLDDLPTEASEFKQHLEEQQITSLLAMPIHIDHMLSGFIGFDAVSSSSKWQQGDVLLLRAFSDVLASAIKRHRIEAALRDSRRTMRTLLDNLPGAAYRCRNDKQWSMLFLSDGITDITGYEPSELVNNRLLSYADMIHPDDREGVEKLVLGAISQGKLFEVEYRILDRWRREHWMWERGELVASGEGAPQIEGFISDITDRKRVERALQMSEDYLRLIMNSTAEAIYGLDEHGHCTSINRAGLEQLGYENESELIGKNMHLMIHHSHPDGSPYPIDDCPIFQAFHQREQIHLESEVFWRKDNSNFPAEYWSYPLIEKGISKGAVVTFIDITERKFNEEVMESRVKLLDYTQGHDVHDLLVFALDEACSKTGSQIGFCHFLEADQKTLTLQAWSSRTTKEFCQAAGDGLHYDLDEAGVWADAVRERRPVIHNDYESLPHKQGLPEGHAPVSCEVCVPVFRHNKIVAIMGVGNRSLQNYGDYDVQKVSRIADLTWDIVENKLIEGQLEQHRKQLSTILDTVTEGVALWDEWARLGYANSSFFTLMDLPVDLWDREAGVGKTFSEFVPATSPLIEFEASLTKLLKHGKSVENLPLEIERRGREPRWIRVTIHALYDSKSGHISGAVSTMVDITEQKTHEHQLVQLAHFDNLTQLPNRLLALDRLHQMIARSRRTGELMAVCYLDLDGFKAVNDSLGHEAGDELLKETANRLVMTVRNGDTVSRLGGDEFLLLLADMKDQQETQIILERILAVAAKPYTVVGSVQSTVTASLGVTLFPNDNSEPDALVHHADQAMYMAKESGKNCYQFFNKDFERRIRAQEETMTEIVKGIDSGQLIVHYQPVIDCREGRVIAAEALIRWDHPVLGLLEPAEFLPLINRNAVMLSISERVIEQAVTLIGRLEAEGLALSVSVNLFPEQSYDPSFLVVLRKQLVQLSQQQRSHLLVELPEHVVASHYKQAEEFINECLNMGVECVLDDFGVGDTSIQQLSGLPVRYIKIDRTLTQKMLSNERKLAMIKSIISMANAFNRVVIVQGVEEERQMATLLTFGCSRMQGYLFSEALPLDEFSQWFKSTVDSPDWLQRFTTS